jgi:hypothetical protein
VIGRAVSRYGRPHQARPFISTFTHGACLAIRPIFQFVTAEFPDHEFVIILETPGAALLLAAGS